MSAVQLVLLEMLADFHTKGKEGAKAMGDQLLSSWPISPSHRMVQELRVEMRNELDQRIDQVSFCCCVCVCVRVWCLCSEGAWCVCGVYVVRVPGVCVVVFM